MPSNTQTLGIKVNISLLFKTADEKLKDTFCSIALFLFIQMQKNSRGTQSGMMMIEQHNEWFHFVADSLFWFQKCKVKTRKCEELHLHLKIKSCFRLAQIKTKSFGQRFKHSGDQEDQSHPKAARTIN